MSKRTKFVKRPSGDVAVVFPKHSILMTQAEYRMHAKVHKWPALEKILGTLPKEKR